MTEPSNKHTAFGERIKKMSRNELKDLLVASSRQLGKAQAAIVQKDRLIADFTSQRDRAKQDADRLVEQARTQAQAIKEEAKLLEEQSERRIEEANAEVARKLENANAEADSIVQSRLTQAQADIERLEAKREEAKRAAIALNKNIVERYDELIDDVESQLSSFKDMKDKIESFNVEIQSEDFKKFTLSDFVTVPEEPKAEPEPAEKSRPTMAEVDTIMDVEQDDLQLDDDDLEVLAEVLSDNFDEVYDDSGVIDEDDMTDTLLDDADVDFLTSDDFDLSDIGLDMDDDGLDAFGEVETEEVVEETYSNGKMKSFTDSFMAVAAVEDDADEDLTDVDVESFLDDVEVEAAQPTINIPKRRNSASSRKSGSAHWVIP